MIENSIGIGKKPSWWNQFTAAGEQRIKEYDDRSAFQKAITLLNAALEPYAAKILALKTGNPPIRLRLDNKEEYHTPSIGSYREKISASAIRDKNGIISLRGELRSDDVTGYRYFDIHRGHVSENYHTVRNEIAVLRIDERGAIQTVSYGLVDETKAGFIYPIWDNKEYIAIPKLIGDRGKQADAILFLGKMLTKTPAVDNNA